MAFFVLPPDFPAMKRHSRTLPALTLGQRKKTKKRTGSNGIMLPYRPRLDDHDLARLNPPTWGGPKRGNDHKDCIVLDDSSAESAESAETAETPALDPSAIWGWGGGRLPSSKGTPLSSCLCFGSESSSARNFFQWHLVGGGGDKKRKKEDPDSADCGGVADADADTDSDSDTETWAVPGSGRSSTLGSDTPPPTPLPHRVLLPTGPAPAPAPAPASTSTPGAFVVGGRGKADLSVVDSSSSSRGLSGPPAALRRRRRVLCVVVFGLVCVYRVAELVCEMGVGRLVSLVFYAHGIVCCVRLVLREWRYL